MLELKSITKKNSIVGVHKITDNMRMIIRGERESNSGNVIAEDVTIHYDGIYVDYTDCNSSLNLGRKNIKKAIEKNLIRLSSVIQVAIEELGSDAKSGLPHGLCECTSCYERSTIKERGENA